MSHELDERERLTLQTYLNRARETDRFASEPSEDHHKKLSFGFFGEVGGLLAALKKGRRDQLVPRDSQAASEEIGDALWYLANLALLSGLTAEGLGKAGLAYLRTRFDEGQKAPAPRITFRSFDGLVSLHHGKLSRNGERLLRDLAAASGSAVSRSYAQMMMMGADEKTQMFGELFGHLALVSGHFNLALETLAQKNLEKVFDRWPGARPRYHNLVPAGKPYEQLPSRLEVEFLQRKVGNRIVVVQQIKGLNIGDPLTDNSHRPDGYRFHDIFHLAYAAHLGWSPVIRALLKVKRKSEPQIDENEDGARAIIIEEGIATWIFNHAKGHKNYAQVEPGRLEYGLLKQVRGMVDGFQVASCPLWQWESAILDGFRVFRDLLANKGGTVVADLTKHSLTYSPPVIPAEQS
jgi:NTP pyrophosphatase (non-canonical NTP hydrolase)